MPMTRSLSTLMVATSLLTAVPAMAAPTGSAWQVAVGPASTPPVGKYQQEEFDVWWDGIYAAEAALNAKEPWAKAQALIMQAIDRTKRKDKVKHLEPHSAFGQGKERLRGLIDRMYASSH